MFYHIGIQTFLLLPLSYGAKYNSDRFLITSRSTISSPLTEDLSRISPWGIIIEKVTVSSNIRSPASRQNVILYVDRTSPDEATRVCHYEGFDPRYLPPCLNIHCKRTIPLAKTTFPSLFGEHKREEKWRSR